MADKSTIELDADAIAMEEALDGAEDSFVEFGEGVNSVTDEIKENWDSAMGAMMDTAKSLFQSGMDAIASYVSAAFDEVSRRVQKGIGDFIDTEAELVRLKQELRALGNQSGFTASQMQDLAKELSSISTFGTQAIRNAEAALAKFGNVRGDIFKDALKSAMDLAAITGDLTGAAEKFGEALNDPIKGLEMLKEAGYSLSAQQKALVDRLLATNDMIGLQKFLLKAASDMMGGNAAEAAKTLAGQAKLLNNVLDDMYETIGGLLVPTFTKYLIPAVQAAGKVVDWLAAKFNSGGDVIGEFIERGIKVAVEWFWKFVEVATQVFSYAETVIEDFGDWFEAMWNFTKGVTMNVLADMLDVIVEWTENAIACINQLWEWFKEMWEKVIDMSVDALALLGDGWKAFVAFFSNAMKNMLDSFKTFWDGIKALASGDAWKGVWKGMVDGFDFAIAGIKAKAKGLGGDLGADLEDPKEKIKGFGDDLREGADKAFDAAEDPMKRFDDKFDDNLKKNKDRVAAFVKTLKDIIDGEKDPKGAAGGKFDFKGRDKDKDEGSHGSAGSFEDLIAMNKRIQGAALQSPETRELDKQTQIMTAWKAQDAQNAQDIIAELNKIMKPDPPAAPPVAVPVGQAQPGQAVFAA